MSQEQESCSSCRFWKNWKEDASNPDNGCCRYSQPAVIGVAGVGGFIFGKTHWPITLANEWCGKWERKG